MVGLLVAVGAGAVLTGSATASTIRRVPVRYATIQEAVDSANPGDEVSVASGRYCGAVVDKPLTLDGHGQATIVGCATGPELFGGLRAGFVLPGVAGENQASGTRVVGFVFDGRGVSADDLEPLAFGVFARFADDVQISGNRFFGTVQAITNTGGDRWVIAHNDIHDLTLFDCTAGLCAGGDGIIIQSASGDVAAPGGSADPVNRPEGNLVFANDIEGTIPDGFDAFSMVGIFVFAADGTVVRENRIRIADNPTSAAAGEAVLISNTCCGNPDDVVPGSRNTIVLFNDGRASELMVVVEGTAGENTQGLVLFGNRGVQLVEGKVVADAGALPRRLRAGRPDHHRRLSLL
jgi:regulator of RNase E activity RraA